MISHQSIIQSVLEEAEKTIIGKRHVIELTLAALLADGHVLFDDIPGIGKTLLVKTFAKILNHSFARIQFTPDLMPSDILGLTIYNQTTRSFDFKPGPIFNDVIMADEINRTSPKTQSALLEAMSENHVTIDGITRPMGKHFFVLATQNPLKFEGTYPLPEAQLDRFMMKLQIGYPEFDDELMLIKQIDHAHKLCDVRPVLTTELLSDLKQRVKDVTIHQDLYEYALKLVRATRHHPNILLGISPRGAQQFILAAKSYALVKGRDYCIPKDFIDVMAPVFGHRLQLTSKEIPLDKLYASIQGAVKAPDSL